MRAGSTNTIKTYNLFGEAGDLPDVVHCETIAARSVLHDWKFELHRHAKLHQFFLIESGGGQAQLEEHTYTMARMQVVNVPIGDVHGFSFTRGTKGWVLTLAAEVMDQVLLPSEGLRRVLSAPIVFRGSAPMLSNMKQIYTEFTGRNFGRAHMLRALTATLVGLVARELARRSNTPEAKAKNKLFEQFEELLEQHFLEHWTVSDYARAMSMTPTHLSRITHAAVGDAASHCITERLVREARRNLVYTNLPVSTIAYALGFSDPAYFSRVFTEATGSSPRRFRAKFGE